MSSHVSSAEITWAELVIQKRDMQNDIDSFEKEVTKLGSENTTELADLQMKLKDARSALADIETKIEANRPKNIESTANSYRGVATSMIARHKKPRHDLIVGLHSKSCDAAEKVVARLLKTRDHRGGDSTEILVVAMLIVYHVQLRIRNVITCSSQKSYLKMSL